MELERLPWEKLSGESAKAFHAFTIYRDLGAARSLAKVGRALGETGVAGPSMVEEWSVRWRWVERSDAFDRDEDRRQREERARAIADARRTEAMAGTLMLGAALRRLHGDPDATIEPLNLNDANAGDVVRLATAGAKLVHQGLGIEPNVRDLNSVSGRAVYDLSRSLLALGIERLEAGMRAAAGSNGTLDQLIALQQETFIDEAGRLYATNRS
jgi:hypothetical protein